jgi:hypothetical protein
MPGKILQAFLTEVDYEVAAEMMIYEMMMGEMVVVALLCKQLSSMESYHKILSCVQRNPCK